MYPEIVNDVAAAFDNSFDAVVDECPHPYQFISVPKESASTVLDSLQETFSGEHFEFSMSKDLESPGNYLIAATYMPSYKWI